MNSVYLIGSLRNPEIPYIGNKLRDAGYDVFDSWHAGGPEADDYWKKYSEIRGLNYKEALQDWSAKHIFEFDKTHLDRCDGCIMIMPAGKSGHLEFGYMRGKEKPGYILFDGEPERFDVMTLFANDVFYSIEELIDGIKR